MRGARFRFLWRFWKTCEISKRKAKEIDQKQGLNPIGGGRLTAAAGGGAARRFLCFEHSAIYKHEANMSPGVAIQVAQGLGVLAGAWAIKSMIDAEDEKPPMAGGFRCSTCNGSRRVPCLCTKWSDNDVGCGTCSGTGMMRCSSCGGSGTGRPIPVQIRASSIPGGGGGNQRSWMNESVSKISSSSSRLAFSSLSLSLSLLPHL